MTEQASDNQGLVPKLRFPEFAGHPLHDIRLGDVTQECKARNKGKFAADLVMGVSKEEGIVPMQARLVAEDISRYKILRKDWFAYNPMRLNIGSIGRWQGDSEVLVSPDYVVFRCEERDEGPTLRADYLDHFRRSTHWSAFTGEAGDGGVRVRIYFDDIAKVRLILPDGAEQQKIAACLSSLDALIAAETDKLAALRDQIKGLMEQLFPRPERVENGVKVPAENAPRLRFPEFRDNGDWEETTIGEVGSFYYGKSAPKWSLEEDAPTPCIRYGELYTKFGPKITKTYSKTNIPPENLKFSKGGEILVPRVGEKPDEFGLNCSYLTLSGVAIGEMISVFETDQNALFYTFYFRHMYRDFAKVVEGQNVKNLYYAVLEPLTIFRPSVREQEQIADCLMSLERLAEATGERLSELKIHKSGLLQRLFPSSDKAAA